MQSPPVNEYRIVRTLYAV